MRVPVAMSPYSMRASQAYQRCRSQVASLADGGYCLDAPQDIPAGGMASTTAHLNYGKGRGEWRDIPWMLTTKRGDPHA